MARNRRPLCSVLALGASNRDNTVPLLFDQSNTSLLTDVECWDIIDYGNMSTAEIEYECLLLD